MDDRIKHEPQSFWIWEIIFLLHQPREEWWLDYRNSAQVSCEGYSQSRCDQAKGCSPKSGPRWKSESQSCSGETSCCNSWQSGQGEGQSQSLRCQAFNGFLLGFFWVGPRPTEVPAIVIKCLIKKILVQKTMQFNFEFPVSCCGLWPRNPGMIWEASNEIWMQHLGGFIFLLPGIRSRHRFRKWEGKKLMHTCCLMLLKLEVFSSEQFPAWWLIPRLT